MSAEADRGRPAPGFTLVRAGFFLWGVAERAFLALWRRIERVLGAIGRGLSLLLSRDGAPHRAWALLFLSVFSSWLTSPLQGGIRGYSAPLLAHDVRLLDGVLRPWRIDSYGTVLLLLLAFGVVTRRTTWRPRAFYTLAGLGVIFLAASWLASLAFARPAALDALVDQNLQLARIKEFDNTWIHGNVGVIAVEALSVEGLADTLWTLLLVAGFGVWFAILAGLSFLQAGARFDTHPSRRRILRAGALASAVLVAGLALPAVVADALRARADGAFHRGDYAKALASYRRAAAVDARFFDQDGFMISLGESAWRSGERGSPEARYYLGTSHLDSLDHDGAAFEFESALAATPAGSPAARAYRRALRDTWRRKGNYLYSQGRPYGAVEALEKALSYDPASIEIPYLLARVYFEVDGPNQARAIETNRILMGRMRDKIFRSDVYCNLGEAYSREGRHAEARVNYERSLDMYDFVKDINYRAQRGMIGL